ncbi:MAG TPA: serine/threonine-protein kinase [Drouetiella sp.]|jgi:serine/threonine protein kinase
MIESKERDSGGFNQNAEKTNAPPQINDGSGDMVKSDPLINSLFADKYFIEQKLGVGGMSVVYRARHEALNKQFAIKTLHTHLTSKASSLMRFKQEAQAASRLQHPGIVAIHDYGVTEEGIPYLVMDYVAGESLADLLNESGSLNEDVALEIFKQTVAAIAHAHHRGIVHRDIKPSNIMLNYDEQHNLHVKIVDFGVAKFVESEESAKLTQTGEALGSPLYMSPEQCLGQPLDSRSDIYSFGCVMYEALVGEPPLKADGVFKIMMKHINDVPPGFKEVRPDLPDSGALERIVFKALAKDPSKRYQRMDDLLADLDGLHKNTNFVQRVKNRFELTGLRQTSRSIKFAAGIFVLLGALTLACANYAINTVQTLSVEPDLFQENPIWQPYSDKPPIKETDDEEKKSLLGDGQGLLLQGSELSLSTALKDQEMGRPTESREQILQRLSDIAYSKITQARSERRHHEYDLAESTYTEAIADINSYIERTSDVQRANALDKLLVSYMGKGDCEYFKSPPNYAAASASYGEAVKQLHKTKNGYSWTQLQPRDQLYLFLRSADSLTMQGRYAEAAEIRQLIPELLRSFDRELRDGSYRALTQSKVAEEAFRLKKFSDAKALYKGALEEWRKDNDTFIREQAMVMARLAEIETIESANNSGNVSDHDTPFLDFETLAEKVRKDDPKLLHSQFFSDAYQAYAHHLWQHHDLLKSIKMHALSVESKP